MDERTRTALEKSIAKWEGIVAGTETDKGAGNCALCKLFIDDDCVNCPVKAKSGAGWCNNTPYVLWTEYTIYSRSQGGRRAKGALQIGIAAEERDFLRSLLPAAP